MMKQRGNWQGMWTIAQFNWPFYLAAIFVIITSVTGFFLVSIFFWKIFFAIAFLGALYFLIGSLGVSHLVYDRSDLYRWNWLEKALSGRPNGQIVICHAGFDEISASLRNRFPKSSWAILDHFDAEQMTEPSIHRARRMFPPVSGTLPAAFDQWPVPSSSVDVILGLLAIHEFRTVEERSRWFSEAARCTKSGGRIIIAEHTRGIANFLAFGPGFLHFHSRENWRRSWSAAGLRATKEFQVTPWVRIFILSVS